MVTPALQPILGVPGGVPMPASPSRATLLFGAGIVSVLIYRRRPPVTWQTVYAHVPWLLVGSVLWVLHDIGAYPASFALTFDAAAAYLTAFVLAGLAWVGLLEFTSDRSAEVLATYIGAMGLGAVTMVVPVVLWQGGGSGLATLIWLLVLPVTAAAVAFVTVVLLGFWHPDAAAYAGFVGGLVVFGHALDGLASVVGIAATGSMEHTMLTRPVAEHVAELLAGTELGVGPELAWSVAFIWLRIVLAALVVALYAPYVRERPSRGNAMLGLIAAFGLGPGAVWLLTIAVGG